MGRQEVKDSQVTIRPDEGESSSAAHDSSRDPTPTEDAPILGAVSRISTTSDPGFKVYKRRFFGLAQLMLLNIVVSWDWLAFASVSKTAATYFDTSESIINWVSIAFQFAFVVATPATFIVLNKRGPKMSIVISACLLLVGNWIKYGGTRSKNFGVVMLGQLLIGFAQPFVLAAPTTYSNLWFSEAGRTTATALASLANPFGAALGQLISPFWVTKPADVPNMILYVSIISSVASLPAFFIPAKPPTLPSTSTMVTTVRTSVRADLRHLLTSLEFHLLFIPFSIYVGFFNAFSSLLNQILEPYGFTETDAGISGAILIVVGLVSAAISSPFIDKYKFYLVYIKIAVPIIALMYLIFVWVPPTRSIAFAYIISGILGAASFGLVPVALEFLVEIHYPLGPEVGSSIFWCGGQLLGGTFIVIMDALKASQRANPPANMHRALIFQAVLSMLALPLPLCLGFFGRADQVRRKRLEADRHGRAHVGDMETSGVEDGNLRT